MKNITAKIIQYYERYVDGYMHETINCEFIDTESKCYKYINPGGNILGIGCGSGRDSKYFVENGYQVTAFGGSIAMSRRAFQYLGMSVLIQEYSFHEQYDSIRYCASLLHLTLSEIKIFLLKEEKF